MVCFSMRLHDSVSSLAFTEVGLTSPRFVSLKVSVMGDWRAILWFFFVSHFLLW